MLKHCVCVGERGEELGPGVGGAATSCIELDCFEVGGCDGMISGKIEIEDLEGA